MTLFWYYMFWLGVVITVGILGIYAKKHNL